MLTQSVIQTTEGRKNLDDIKDVPEILRYALDDNGCQQVIILPSREGVGGVLEGILMDNKVDKVDVYHTPLPLSRGDLKTKTE